MPNPYLDAPDPLAQQEAVQAPRTDNPYLKAPDPLAVQTSRAALAVAGAASANPDRAAENQQLATRYNVSPDVVDKFPEEFRQRALTENAATVLRQAPTLRDTIASNPQLAQVAHDDVKTLAAVEQTVRQLPVSDQLAELGLAPLRGLGFSFNRLGRFGSLVAGGLPAAYGYLTGDTRAADWWFSNTTAGYDADVAKGSFNVDPRAWFASKALNTGGEALGTISQAVLSGGTSEAPAAANAVPTVAQAIANIVGHGSRAMVLPSLTAGVNTASDVYNETDSGAAALKAGEAAYGTSTLGGIIPFGAPGRLGARLLTGATSGLLTGELNHRLMNAAMPDSMQQPGETGEDRALDALSGAVFGGLAGPHDAADLMRRTYTQARETYVQAARAQEATTAAQTLSQLSQLSAQAKLRERDPEAYREFVQKVADDGHVQEVWINGQALLEGLQQSGVPLNELQDKMPDLAGQLHEAVQTGGDVRIPIGDYATSIAGTETDKVLLPKLKTSPDGMTFEQGQEYLGQQQAEMTARAAQVVNEQTAEGVRDQQLSGIAAKVQQQLEATGRMPSDVARTNAGLVRAWYDHVSDRVGVTPAELESIIPAPTILAERPNGETLTQGQEQEPRAYFNPATGEIGLLKGADLSSFLHESGHFFLEGMHKLALRDDATSGLKDDFDVLLKHFGVEGATPGERMAAWTGHSLDEKRAGHEAFAEGFEHYLMEGRAPVPELQSMFSRFRAWLMSVYKSLRGEVSPEVRGVMDRMFASEEAIREAERARGYLTPELPADFAGPVADLYKHLGHEATEQAIADMQARSLRDMQWLTNAKTAATKELQREAREHRQAIAAEVTREVEALPAYKAVADLREAAPSTDVQRDLIAEKHGYASQVEMLQDIAAHGPKGEAIRDLTDQRMLERHGELTDPQAIERAAEAAIHNEARARMMATGLKMFTKSPMSALDIAKAAKVAADTAVARKRVGELRPAQYSAAETRANREVLKLAPRDPAGAAAAQREALLSNRLFSSTTQAVDDVRRGLAYLKRLQSTASMKKIAGEERAQIVGLLGKYDFRKNPTDEPTRAEVNLRKWMDAQVKSGNMPHVDPNSLEAQPRTAYRDLSVEQFRGLIDTVRSMEQIGREATRLTIEGNKVDLRQVVDNELVPAMEKRGERHSVSEVLDHPDNQDKSAMRTALDGVTSWMNRAHEMTLDPVHRMEILDNHQVLGPFAKAIFNPMFEAGVREARMTRKVSDMAREAAKAVGREWQESLGDQVPNRTLIDAQASRQEGRRVYLRITRENLVAMLVHAGNESNFDRLCRGREWDPEEVQRFINENMTPKDLEAANWIWHIASTHWDEQVAQARRLGAIVPEKIEARAFDTPVGRAEGGYAPLRYDPLRSRVGAKAEQAAEVNPHEALRSAGSYLDRQSTVAGSMHERLDNYVDVVDLRLSRIEEAVREDVHDLAFRETILDRNKIMNDPNFRTAFMRAYGRNEYQAMTGWVRHFVNSAQMDRNVDAFDAALRYTRTGIVANAIGFRASTIEKHGMSAALKSFGYFINGGEKFFLKRLGQMVTDYQHQTDTAMAKFGEIYTRSLQFDRDYRETVKSLLEPESLRAKAHRYGHWLVARADLFTAVPTAWAAYDRAVTEGIPVSQGGTGKPMTDAEATAYASNLVRSAHGGSTDVTASNLMNTNSEAVKLFTMMFRFMNNSYGQASSIVDRLRLQGYKAAPEALAQSFMLFAVPAVVASLVRYGLPSKDHLAQWLEEAGLSETIAMIPGGSQFLQLVQSARGAGESPVAQWESTLIQEGKDVNAIAHGKAPAKPIQDAGNALGTLGHVSGAGQAGTTMQYLHDVITGKEHPEGVGEFLHGMAQGSHKAAP